MREQVCTGFSPAGEGQYGRRMVEAFHQHWPASVDLVVYVEQATALPRGTARRLADVPGWTEFLERWHSVPKACGRGGRKAYDYRFDAVKFARQAFMACDAAEQMGEGCLTWFDGDTVTTADVPDGFLASLLSDADVAYLGRQAMWPEIGYVGYRLPQAMPLLLAWRSAYASGSFRTLEQWHSAFVWRWAAKVSGVRGRDLTSHLYEGKSHIWPVSPLAPYTRHFKGGKKKTHVEPAACA